MKRDSLNVFKIMDFFLMLHIKDTQESGKLHPDGKLQCLEVYKKDNNVWKQIMYGSDGSIFF